jgi:hypothetical protein
MATETPVKLDQAIGEEVSIKSTSLPIDLLRRYIQSYNIYVQYEGKEPITVTLHECSQHYGGPEEGGWYYQRGWAVKTICVFSKKQAIKEAIKLHQEAQEEYGDRIDELGWPIWEVNFSNDYGRNYPTHRPYYE